MQLGYPAQHDGGGCRTEDNRVVLTSAGKITAAPGGASNDGSSRSTLEGIGCPAIIECVLIRGRT